MTTIINIAFDRGWGIERIIALLEDAVRANQTRYGTKEIVMAIVLHELGGLSVLQVLLHAEKMLPSPSHAARSAAQRRIPVQGTINVEGDTAT